MKKPKSTEVWNKNEENEADEQKSFKGKIKNIKLSSVKEKLEDLKIKKSKLERLKQKIKDYEETRIESEVTEINLDSKASTHQDLRDPQLIKEKYKSIQLLAKTRQYIKEDQDLKTNHLDIVQRKDLETIQDDLSDMLHSIFEQEKKYDNVEDIAWESIKTFPERVKSQESLPELNLKEYWIKEFYSVFDLYSKSYQFEEIITYLSNSLSLKIPFLKRIYFKLDDMKNIWLFSKEKTNNEFLDYLK